jgi:hypothetical protein
MEWKRTEGCGRRGALEMNEGEGPEELPASQVGDHTLLPESQGHRLDTWEGSWDPGEGPSPPSSSMKMG